MNNIDEVHEDYAQSYTYDYATPSYDFRQYQSHDEKVKMDREFEYNNSIADDLSSHDNNSNTGTLLTPKSDFKIATSFNIGNAQSRPDRRLKLSQFRRSNPHALLDSDNRLDEMKRPSRKESNKLLGESTPPSKKNRPRTLSLPDDDDDYDDGKPQVVIVNSPNQEIQNNYVKKKYKFSMQPVNEESHGSGSFTYSSISDANPVQIKTAKTP